DEFEMISLSDSCTEEESCIKSVVSKRGTHKECEKQQQQQQQQHDNFTELLEWISQEGEEFVHIESFSNLRDVFNLLDVIGCCPKPLLMTILIRENEPNIVTVSLSSVKVGVQCLLFCMFQASAEVQPNGFSSWSLYTT
ncbi:hypothetical protein ACROYT_G032703, partial [Oculina patagonica]